MTAPEEVEHQQYLESQAEEDNNHFPILIAMM